MMTEASELRRMLFAPRTPAEIAAAARMMAAEFGDHTIASALGISVEMVRRLLGRCEDCE